MNAVKPIVIDLRSDTVTQPTEGMRRAMMEAPLGDDVFGDDPSVNALQEKIAAMLGFEAALFMPSGTQSNLCAILAHCGRGDEYIVGQQAHTYRYEGGGAAVLGSVQPQPLAQDKSGLMDLVTIEQAIKPDDPHFAKTRLLCLENTWNGYVMPFSYLEEAAQLARRKNLNVHLDGARLFNAAVAQAADLNAKGRVTTPQQEAKRIAGLFDSVSVCFSKGLGAPVGSTLCGSRDYLARARRIRKMAGGGLRQAGLLAAAASYALDNHIERLQQDHDNALFLAQGLAEIDAMEVLSCQSNIVFARTRDGRDVQLIEFLRQQGILVTGLIGLRFVTHLGVEREGIKQALHQIRNFCQTPS
jgi:threonine aldolase